MNQKIVPECKTLQGGAMRMSGLWEQAGAAVWEHGGEAMCS